VVNWSWTYDSALAAAGLAALGERAEAEQLLDQLATLQNGDGSIAFAFNVVTGASSSLLRAGTIAWMGLAAGSYDLGFGSDRYRALQQRAADYLLSLHGADGLIRGGPDVSWVATEHNLAAYAFLTRLGAELRAAGDSADAARYGGAATRVAAGIDANLLVQDSAGARFIQGLGDTVEPLDVQALGALYLSGRGERNLAQLVLAGAQSSFSVSNRSIADSTDPADYNTTYSSAGPFVGYAPYAGAGAPDVLWFEGTLQMRIAQAASGQDTSALDQSIARWIALTAPQGDGPLQADRAVTSTTYGIEYHVWPAAAPAAWYLLSQAPASFFAAPPQLPPQTGTAQVPGAP
jgi:hypothetical protein